MFFSIQQFRLTRSRRVHGLHRDRSARALQGPVLRDVLRADADVPAESELYLFAAAAVPGHDRQQHHVRRHQRPAAAQVTQVVPEGVPLPAADPHPAAGRAPVLWHLVRPRPRGDGGGRGVVGGRGETAAADATETAPDAVTAESEWWPQGQLLGRSARGGR